MGRRIQKREVGNDQILLLAKRERRAPAIPPIRASSAIQCRPQEAYDMLWLHIYQYIYILRFKDNLLEFQELWAPRSQTITH